ncbi:MAG: hypothetical protein JW811_03340 [Clostridiales bacterium]|nr:hypothetical protein [Clostridiales bacterium]
MKKTLSVLLALVLVISAIGLAAAESTETAEDAVTADDGTEATVYTLNEMLTRAMADAYLRQAAYAAYAEAFPDSRSIAGIDMDTQIVLLEMLLKANGAALPASVADVSVPETKAEAYAAIAEAESSAVTMYKSFLRQEDLAADARIIFQSVFRIVRSNALAFREKAQAADRAEKLQELRENENAQVYVISGGRNGRQVIYVITSEGTANDEDAATETDTTDTTTEDSAGD